MPAIKLTNSRRKQTSEPPRNQGSRLLVCDRRDRSVDLRQGYRERFFVTSGPVLQDADRHRLTQLDGRIGVAPPMHPVKNSMSKGDIVRKLVQLAIHCQPPGVVPRVGNE